MKKVLTLIFTSILALLLAAGTLNAQTAKISGYVYDLETGEPLEMANIKVKGTGAGSTSDANGFFSFEVSGNESVVLQVSFIGYKTAEVEARPGSVATINLESDVIMGDEVVISASRVDEKIKEAPLTIQKMNVKQIENAPSGDYFGNLTTMRDVEVINNSIGFKVINARGFNTTSQFRVVQFIDGVDNQLPTINIVPGNMFGVNDIDIESVEMISGPASAMYGPNAMQGVLSYNTKSPFKYRGVSLMVKGGNREYAEAQFRYGDVFFNGKLGFKITGSYMSAMDWKADDPVYNRYGNRPTPFTNFDDKIQELIDNPATDPAVVQQLQAFQNYASQYPDANPGSQNFTMPGYMESDIYDGKTNNYKIGGGLYYKFNKDVMAFYEGRYSTGTSIFMGNNRAPLEGFSQMQHLLGLDYKGFSFKAYMNKDNTNETYSMPTVGTLIGIAAGPSVGQEYLQNYLMRMAQLSGGFTDPYQTGWYEDADDFAMNAANEIWYKPGTAAFDSLVDIYSTENPPAGGHYSSKTTLYHVEGQYDRSFNKLDLTVGASYRNTNPVSNGTVFRDTGDVKINYYEIGGFAQGIWNAVDEKLKIFGSVRADKNENYDLQLSPRLAFVYNVTGNHILRLTGQSAFRSPTATDMYQYLNKGYGFTIGNIDGYSGGYSASSVGAAQAAGDAGLLEVQYVEAVKPEQLKSIELGYYGLISNTLALDLSIYYNMYSDFITYATVMTPNSGVAGDANGDAAAMAGQVKPYLVATNSNKDMSTYGASIGLSYYINPTLKIYGNYTFTDLDTAGYNKDESEILGFNTPKHKINVGASGKIYKGFGFAINWRWVDDYTWESAFWPQVEEIDSYNVTDLQFSFEVPRLMSVLRVGGSNIFDQKYTQATGMPQIGGFYYASWTFNLDFGKD